MSYVVTKKPLILPRDIIDLYEAEFFSMKEEVRTKQSSKQLYETYRDTTIKVFTEAQLPNGDCVRAHPSFGDAGPVYDFVLVPGKQTTTNETNKKKKQKRMHDQNEPHFHDIFPFHVPARIISFFSDPFDGKEKAFVHQCKDRSEWNKENDSVLLESWTLETQIDDYYLSEDGEYHQDKARHRRDCKEGKTSRQIRSREALFWTIPISSIKCGLFAIPDLPMFDAYNINSEDAAHVMVVIDHNLYWASLF
jgi:hypothetical protein